MDSLQKRSVVCLAMVVFIIAFIPFYWAGESSRQQTAITRVHTQSVERGGKTFATNCAGCHGSQAQGGVGPTLAGKSATLIKNTVRSGRGIMPAFGTSEISDSELDDVVIFLAALTGSTGQTSQTGSPPSSPPATKSQTTTGIVGRGQQLYQGGAGGIGCAGCHGTDARGSLGPNIVGKSAAEIKTALTGVTAMTIIKMTDDEIQAVAAYLASIGTQP